MLEETSLIWKLINSLKANDVLLNLTTQMFFLITSVVLLFTAKSALSNRLTQVCNLHIHRPVEVASFLNCILSFSKFANRGQLLLSTSQVSLLHGGYCRYVHTYSIYFPLHTYIIRTRKIHKFWGSQIPACGSQAWSQFLFF
jgi:hypothetical protein